MDKAKQEMGFWWEDTGAVDMESTECINLYHGDEKIGSVNLNEHGTMDNALHELMSKIDMNYEVDCALTERYHRFVCFIDGEMVNIPRSDDTALIEQAVPEIVKVLNDVYFDWRD